MMSPISAFAVERNAGEACTISGSWHRQSDAGGVTQFICNGTTWVSLNEYSTSGRSTLQIDNDAGVCNAAKTGRLRYDDGGDSWDYCTGSAWAPFEQAGSISGSATCPNGTGGGCNDEIFADFDEAYGAYSLTQLSSGAAVDVVRVRRSSDVTEQDFNATEVTDGTLLTFVQAAIPANRMFFDRTNDYVDFGTGFSELALSNAFSGRFTLYTGPNVTTTQGIINNNHISNNAFGVFIKDSHVFIQFYNGSSFLYRKQVPVTSNTQYDVEFTYDGAGTSALTVGGVAGTSSLLAASVTSTNFVVSSRQPAGGLVYLNGSVWDIELFSDAAFGTKFFEVQGYGNTDADWEDQVGSKDGTVNGSPGTFSGQAQHGYISTWYDQSGFSNDSVIDDVSRQPLIVNDGTLIVGSGSPPSSFDERDTLMIDQSGAAVYFLPAP